MVIRARYDIIYKKGWQAVSTNSNSISVLSGGSNARIQRVCRLLTQQEIAAMVGVTQKDVELFEDNQYIQPTTQAKLVQIYKLIKEIPNHRFC